MFRLLKSGIGRLRLLALLEGLSLLLLIFVAVPMKYVAGDRTLVTVLGPVHGALVLLYLFNCFSTAVEYSWKFRQVTGRLLLACLLPFGTMYMDRIVLRPLYLAGKR
ncbi:MAG: DUF3817 domain-containing protein [Chitinophagaceae bacterium]|nr:MAG: DUF3817 domain-containing protein [Chitinophagaceae bacterium]